MALMSQPRSVAVLYDVAPAARRRRPSALSLSSGHPSSDALRSYIARISADVRRPSRSAISPRTCADSLASGSLCWPSAWSSTCVTRSTDRHEGQVIIVMAMTVGDASESVKRHGVSEDASPARVTRSKSLTLAYRQRSERYVTMRHRGQKGDACLFDVVARARLRARKDTNLENANMRHPEVIR